MKSRAWPNAPRIAKSPTKPFTLYLSHKAVHGGFTPAERHKGRYADRQFVEPKTMNPANHKRGGRILSDGLLWPIMPKDGGDWYYKINEHKVYVRDVGGWNFKINDDETGANGLELSIKPEWLLAGDQQGPPRKA